jgi:hypothetical protein
VREVDAPGGIGSDITVTFQITEKKFIQGCQRGYRHSAYLPVLVPVTIVIGLLAANNLRTHNSVVWIPVAIFAIGYWPWFVLVQPKWTFSRKASARELRRITYSEAGSHHQGETYTLYRPWSTYRGVFECPDMYLLRYQGGNTNTLPKRAFASQLVEEAFRSIASKHVKCHFLSR